MLLSITRKELFTQFLTMPVTDTINKKYNGDPITYTTEDSWCENVYDYGVIDTGIQT